MIRFILNRLVTLAGLLFLLSVITFWVNVMDGRSKYGPYSSLNDAMSEFSKWCLA